MKLCVMADHVILLMNGMIILHEERPLLIILTTVWLSQRTEMRLRSQCCPQIWHAMCLVKDEGQLLANHCPWKKPPKPTDGAASVKNCSESEEWTKSSQKKVTPFQWSSRWDQKHRSDRHPSSSDILSCKFGTVVAVSRRREIKERRWRMTHIAKLRWCFWRHGMFLFSMEFSVMRRNSRRVYGPIVFSSDRGTTRDSKQCLSLEREAPELSWRGSMRMKSVGTLTLFRRIQHNASDSWLKILGLLLPPKVRRTAKSNLDFHRLPSKFHCEGCMGMILKASVMSALESQAPCPASFINFIALSTVA